MLEPSFITMPVYRGRGRKCLEVARTKIDACDYALKQYKWCLSFHGYVYTYDSDTRKSTYLHQAVLCAGSREINHINGNPLDNRRHNLEISNRSLNSLNPNDRVRGVSRFRGVSRDGMLSGRPWRGKIKRLGRLYCTSRYSTELEAAYALNDLRQSLGLPIDLRVLGPLPAGHGNPNARSRPKTPANVRPK